MSLWAIGHLRSAARCRLQRRFSSYLGWQAPRLEVFYGNPFDTRSALTKILGISRSGCCIAFSCLLSDSMACMTLVSKSLFWLALLLAQLPVLWIYLTQLGHNPIYGWLPLLCILAAVILFALRWNRQLELPQSVLALFVVACGVVAAGLAAVTGHAWLGIVGLLATSWAFLASQRDGRQQSLLSIWLLTWPLVRLPAGGNDALTQLLNTQLTDAIEGILRLREVPHVTYPNAIGIPGTRLYFDQLVYSPLSWPAFVSVAMLCSAIWRREWYIAALNVLAALFWCFAFQTCVLLASIRFAIPTDSVSFKLVLQVGGVIAFLLFLSTERGVRCLLRPITEGLSDARLVNPFVLAWNWCFATRKKRAARDTRMWGNPVTLRASLVALFFLFVLQLFQVPSVLRASGTLSRPVFDAAAVQKQVFQDNSVVDYRHTNRSAPLVIGQEAEVWTEYSPISMTEHVWLSNKQRPFDAKRLFEMDGWQLVDSKSESIQLANGQVLNIGDASFSREPRHAQTYFAWLSEDGRPLNVDDAQANGYLLMSAARLSKSCSELSKRSMRATFLKFVDAVQTQLVQTQN